MGDNDDTTQQNNIIMGRRGYSGTVNNDHDRLSLTEKTWNEEYTNTWQKQSLKWNSETRFLFKFCQYFSLKSCYGEKEIFWGFLQYCDDNCFNCKGKNIKKRH